MSRFDVLMSILTIDKVMGIFYREILLFMRQNQRKPKREEMLLEQTASTHHYNKILSRKFSMTLPKQSLRIL